MNPKTQLAALAAVAALSLAACSPAPAADAGSVCQTTGGSCAVDADCCGGFGCVGGLCVFLAGGSSGGQTTSFGGSGSSSSGTASGSGASGSGSSGSSGSSSGPDCGPDNCAPCPAGYVPANSCVGGSWQCACDLGSSSSGGSSGSQGSSSSGSSSGCPRPDTICNGVCVDTSTDPANCGGCGSVCPAGATCAGGACAISSCAAAGLSCMTQSCCPGLDCDPTSFTCAPPVADAGCASSPAGGGCLTAASCTAPDVCLPASDGGGFCGPATSPSALCVANGQACSASSGPCCGGSCVSGSCVARSACGVTGQTCAGAADCCNDFACAPDGGGCQPSCGAVLAACNTANGNADCCTAQGLSCLAVSSSGTSGVCYYAEYLGASGSPIYCGDPCSSLPCALGTPCQVSGGADPCAAAGLVCDQQGSVCSNPAEQDPCLPGGPACQPLAGSTVTDLQCLPYPASFGGATYNGCFQPCGATSDCVDPLTTCVALGGTGAGSECFPNELQSCPTPFGPCNSAGTGDGICVPYNFSNGISEGLCFQATLDGGAPGSACDPDNNRQNGGFCDTTSFCLGGLCEAACNAGTSGGPACAQDAGAGVTVACEAIFGQSGDATDFGTCSVACNFTSDAGGGCATVNGVPEKCLPPADFGLTDAPTGLCIQAPPASEQVAVGQPCGPFGTFADDCADGALCYFDGSTLSYLCVQLCTNLNQTGAPCKADQLCNPLFGAETQEGFCGLPDGGFGG